MCSQQVMTKKGNKVSGPGRRRPKKQPPSRRHHTSLKIRISVTQGDLAHALFPVTIGHFQGDGIVSAERVMDYYLNGRLNERLRLDVYPGPKRTADILLNTNGDPPGAVIIGLGKSGQLSFGILEESFENAVLALALKYRVREPEQPVDEAEDTGSGDYSPHTGISTLLVGSGYGGLSMHASIRAILTALRSANLKILDENVPNVQPITQIEFIELFQDRAVQAARVLHDLLESGRFNDFEMAENTVRRVSGGRRQIPNVYNADWWHKIKIEALRMDKPGLKPLRFTSLTERARADIDNLVTNRGLVDHLIEKAVTQEQWDRKLSKALFESLIPNEFKPYAVERRNLLLIVDKETAAYPWELLYDTNLENQEPLAVRAGMLRQLATAEYRRLSEFASKGNVLVIGDPQLEGRAPQLPAALQEAEEVVNLFRDEDYAVEAEIRSKASDVVLAMRWRGYQVIHIAAHGVVNDETLGGTGIVIGKDHILHSTDFGQMTQVPELVFVNCCHLGEIDEVEEAFYQQRYRLAANIGTQLIEMGVKAAVIAGWAVHDKAAAEFARVFYREMLDGESFGDAVRLARYRIFSDERYGHLNTWGAYQCYGDPFYKLSHLKTKSARKKRQFVDPTEAIFALENIIESAETGSSRHRKRLKSTLDELVDGLPDDWLFNARIIELIAHAQAELDMFEESLQSYEKLLVLSDSRYSFAAVEVMCNIKGRLGVDIAMDPDHYERGRKIIEESIEMMETLIQIAPSAQRQIALASLYKRLATAEHEFRKRLIFLHSARKNYSDAFYMPDEGRHLHYPLVNWMTITAILVRLGHTSWEKSIEETALLQGSAKKELIDEALRDAERREGVRPTFWDKSAPAAALMVSIIEGDNVKQNSERYLQIYRDAWKRGGSYRKRRTIEEHCEFIIAALQPNLEKEQTEDDKKRARRLKRTIRSIAEIKAQLVIVMPEK